MINEKVENIDGALSLVITATQKDIILSAFQSEDGLKAAIGDVEREVENFDYNTDTSDGRKEIASFAHKISKFKVKLDDMGKDLVSGWKSKAKIVDQSRRVMRDRLDELKVTARKPLTDFENAEAEKVTAKLEAEKIQQEAKELEEAHEYGLLMNDKFDREAEAKLWAKNEAEKQEREKAALQVQIREKEIADQAAFEAEQRAKDAEILAEHQKKEKEKAITAAKSQKLASEKREKAAKELAEQQTIAAKKASNEAQKRAVERARMDAEQAEQEKIASIESERLARLRNEKHVAAVDSEIIDKLVWEGTVTEAKAKKVLKAIKAGLIPNISVAY